jgi:glyoxalase family protein
MIMPGLHHVTAIAGDAVRNHDFYTRVLGLRLVKKTVNYDDPATYHLYFGDEAGSPGTLLTFFPWGHMPQGRGGVGLTQTTAFRVPESAIGYWAHRLVARGVQHDAIEKRFGEPVLSFRDPDGLGLALVGVAGAETEAAWAGSDVPVEQAIRGFHGATLLLDNAAPTAAVLGVLGFNETAREGSFVRYAANGAAGIGGVIDIREAKGFLAGRMGRGSVHHLAFRAKDDQEQADMRRRLTQELRLHVTEQIDRNYFRSMYFKEPGGVIFEIATDRPGFAIDEPVEKLGTTLALPPFLEGRRAEIEANLAPLEEAA